MTVHTTVDAGSVTAGGNLVAPVESTAGDPDRLVVEYLEFASAIAARYVNRGIDREDLIQVARLGLVMAARRFDPQRGLPFSSYAGPTIYGEIKRHFRDHGWVVRPPRHLQELNATIRVTSADLGQRLGREPTRDELAETLQVGLTELASIENAGNGFRSLSLDSGPGANGDGAWHEVSEPGGDFTSRLDDHEWLGRAVAGLSERDRRMLRMRFVDEWTQGQIANQLEVSQMQISRLLRAALAKLRTALDASNPAA